MIFKITIALLVVLMTTSCSVSRDYQSRAKSALRSIENATGSDSALVTEEPSEEEVEKLESLGYLQGDNDEILLSESNVEAADGEVPEGSDPESEDDEGDDAEESTESEEDEDSEDGEETEAGTDSASLVPGTGLIPRQWPVDVSLMPGFEVKYGASDSAGQRLVAFGVAPVEEVREYYKGLEGWESDGDFDPEIEMDEESGIETIRLLVVLNKDNNTLTIDIVENPEETLILLLYTGG